MLHEQSTEDSILIDAVCLSYTESIIFRSIGVSHTFLVHLYGGSDYDSHINRSVTWLDARIEASYGLKKK